MALFGLFGKKDPGSALRKHASRVANKRAQATDRWDSIQALARAGTSEAVEALLPRFTFYVDPSITDQEEKDIAYEGVLAAGDAAVGPVTAFLRTAESIAWPLKMLSALVDQGAVVACLIDSLETFDVEYERDPQRKIDIIAALGEIQDPRVTSATVRFLKDSNETVRFSAVAALLAQPSITDAIGQLVGCLVVDESVRVRNRIVEGLARHRATVPPEVRKDVAAQLSPAHKLDAGGCLVSA